MSIHLLKGTRVYSSQSHGWGRVQQGQDQENYSTFLISSLAPLFCFPTPIMGTSRESPG